MAKKHIHVHVHAPTRDGEEGEGRWVTIHGAHVHIGEGGKIDKGPAHLVDKSEHEAHAHGHDEQAKAHKQAAEQKGKDHPEHAAHVKASKAHAMAAAHFKSAHAAAERGDIREAGMSHKAGEREAKIAQQHAEAAQPKAAPEGAPKEKPKAHQALHAEAEDDVKGSEKHEAEHKRLMKLYDTSKADWERNAVNRQLQNNATAAVQHKAQALHHKALSASEFAKHSDDVSHHENALQHIDAAIAAHGRAGGVGYAAKQEELQKARKQHAKRVEDANKSLAKAGAQGRYKQGADSPYEESKDHGALEAAHRSTARGLRHMGQHKDADKHEAAADFHKKAAASGKPLDSEDAHNATKAAGAPMKPPAGVDHDAPFTHRDPEHAASEVMRRGEDLKRQGFVRGKDETGYGRHVTHFKHADGRTAVVMHDVPDHANGKPEHLVTSTIIPAKKAAAAKKAASASRGGTTGALDNVAKRVAERAAKSAADEDPKHKT